MAFTVEDGTVVAGANSFTTIAYADAYFTDRGVTAWTGADAAKQAALIKATDYISNRFRFKGVPVDEDQPLPFPRDEAGDLPESLQKATCEYALRALGAELAPDPEVDDRGRAVISKTEKIGPIEESTAYQQGGSIYVFRPYPAADILLRDLIQSGQGRVIRG